MLYKIVLMCADHGVSVFPPEDQELPEPVDLAGEPIRIMIRKLLLYGYTQSQAYHILSAWAYHAKYDLHQLPRGVRVYCEMCIKQLPVPIPPETVALWPFALVAAVAAAVYLGLYLWVTLDVEKGQRFRGHPWAYVMLYQERLWQGEILNVGYKQLGYYEQGGELGNVLVENKRNFMYIDRRLDMFMIYRRLVLEGRRLIFYHMYRFTWWAVFYCGVLTNIGDRLYKLREGGSDPYKPGGPWSRPGGRMFTPEYEGCWQEFWWL